MTAAGHAAAAVLLLGLIPPLGARAEGCPFLPQYAQLQQVEAAAPATAALAALYAYAADPANENPAACEAFDIDRRIGDRERDLVALVSPNHPPLHPYAAFHCGVPDPRTTSCQGILADDTLHPGTVLPPTVGHRTARLRNGLPGARVTGLYVTSLAAIFAGRRPRRVPATRPLTVAARPGGTVLIALLTAPAPFRVRKLVWYY